ncbi:MAG: molybdenum cofactor biosynthesis protein MoaE [Planctomycetaceae bacterium]
MISLTEDPIDYGQLTEQVRHNNAGAVVLFLGTVREMTGDRQTNSLDYEAYPEMAEARMRDIEAQAREKWNVQDVAAVHRLGHMDLGEISVAVAVSAAHRKEAFAAGRFVIDTIKDDVPIWKKENWADGSTEWVHPGVSAPAPPSAGEAS